MPPSSRGLTRLAERARPLPTHACWRNCCGARGGHIDQALKRWEQSQWQAGRKLVRWGIQAGNRIMQIDISGAGDARA
jgi:hypothetical protein